MKYSSSSSNSFPPDPPSIPLFSRNMPGILSRDELLNPPPQLKASLDDIILNIRGQHATTSDLVAWEDGSVDRMNSVKGLIGDLVAAVGWELAVEMVVSFTSWLDVRASEGIGSEGGGSSRRLSALDMKGETYD